MKGLGIGLIVVGILMLIFTNINFTTEEKVVDIGPLEVNKEKEHQVGWPTYVGGIVLLAGVGVLIMGRKK
jgi:hypothetical protein